MRVRIDQVKCLGSGQCVRTSPQVFDQRDQDGIVVLLDEDPPSELHEATREAAKLCPAQAIAVDED